MKLRQNWSTTFPWFGFGDEMGSSNSTADNKSESTLYKGLKFFVYTVYLQCVVLSPDWSNVTQEYRIKCIKTDNTQVYIYIILIVTCRRRLRLPVAYVSVAITCWFLPYLQQVGTWKCYLYCDREVRMNYMSRQCHSFSHYITGVTKCWTKHILNKILIHLLFCPN